jgi:fibronectin-binding autotransporter adhesin
MRRLWIVMVVLTAVGGVLGETIDPTDYANSVRIRFDGYAGSTPLTNFPALLTFTGGENGFSYSDMESGDYSDLRFAQADGTSSIPYEVEAWNATAPASVQPTNISGCLLWLKADAGAQTNASGGVTNWLDQSGNGNHAASQAAATHPEYATNAVNGQPVVRFSGADDNYIKFTRFTTIRTVFWVIKEDSDAAASARFLLGDQGGNTYHFHRGGGKMIWNGSHAPLMFNGTTELNGTEINGRTTVMPTAMSVLSVRTAGNAVANSLSRDRAGNGRSWDGDVAELIIYDRPLTPREMAGIYLYLEAKHGIDVDVTDPATTTSHVWVQVPVLTNNATIHAYWGNTNATALPAYTTNGAVWSDGYAAVWHLAEPAGTRRDSSPNGRDGIPQNGTTHTAGQLGTGADFDGADDWVDIPNDFGIFSNHTLTISFWFNTSVIDGNARIPFGAGGEQNLFVTFGDQQPNDTIGLRINDGSWKTPVTAPGIQANRWYSLAATFDPVSGYAMHLDGAVRSTSGLTAGRTVRSADNCLGALDGTSRYFNGVLDEVRVSGTVRSADWIRACHDNMSDPGSFSVAERHFYWDTSATAGLQPGNGAWGTSNAMWSSSTFASDPLMQWEDGALANLAAPGVSTIAVDTVTAHGVIVDGSGYELTGGSLTVDRGGIVANESLGIGSAVTLADAQEWTVATGKTMTVSGAVNNGGHALTVLGKGDTTLAGVISGAGGLTKEGTGTLLIDAYDTFTGGTLVNGGVLQLNRGGQTGALRGLLTIAPDGSVDLTAENALGWGADRITTLNINGGLLDNIANGDNGWGITINMAGGELRSNGGVGSAAAPQYFSLGGGSTIRSLGGADTAVVSGRVNLRENNPGNSLPFDVADGGAATGLLVTAVITEQGGARAITKTGGGVMAVTADNVYSGGTTIDNGTLLVNNTAGSGVGSGAVTLEGGMLGGDGTVGADVAAGVDGGFVSPGASVGELRIEGDLDLTSAGGVGLYIEIDATNAHDVLTVTGLVTLGDAVLAGEVGFTPGSNDTFFVLVNEGADAIVGTFGGIAQGGTFELDGTTFKVSYEGDSATEALTGGNDVVLYNGAATGGPGGPGDPPYWMQIGFTGYSRPTPLTNFPALVLLREDLDDFSFGGFVSGSGDDLRFFDGTNAGKTELNYEIEAWDTNGESLVWIQIPVLTSNATVWAYWGDTNMAAQPAYTTNGAAWTADFGGVWHLHSTNTTGELADSTPAGNDGQNSGTVNTAGQIGDAQDWPGDNYITISPDALSAVSNEVTVSLWKYGAASQPRQQDTFSAMVGANRVIQAHLPWSNGNVYWDAGLTGASYDRINRGAAANLYRGRWNLWTFTKNTATGSMKIYVNGELWHSGSGKTRSMAGADAFRLGGQATGGLTYRGSIDEFRVSSSERSADWIWACYRNQREPASFAGTPREASYWDTSPALGIQGGSGTWDSGATASWSEDDVLGSTPLLSWQANNDAHFTAPGPATVTVAAGVVAGQAILAESGYTLAGGTLTLSDGIAAAESVTFSAPLALSDSQAYTLAAGKTLSVNGGVNNDVYTLTLDGGGAKTFTSIISGAGAVVVDAGTVTYNRANQYSGNTVVNAGATLRLNRLAWNDGRPVIGHGTLVIKDGGYVVSQQSQVFGHNLNGSPVTVEGTGRWLAKETYTKAINMTGGSIENNGGYLRMKGGITVHPYHETAVMSMNLKLNGNRTANVGDGSADPDFLLSGVVINANILTKTGAGTMVITGNNTYSAGTRINSGTLLVNNTSGSGTGTGPVTINGGTLGGTGSVAAAVSLGANGGSIAPGSMTGTLTVNSNVTFTTAGAKSFDVRVDGGPNYSQLAVNGSVVLDGVTLDLSVTDGVEGGETLFVIVNDGTDPVTGTFDGLGEGQTFTVTDDGGGEVPFTIHYAGDSATGSTTGGNDVVLVTGAPGTLLLVR